MRVRKTDYTLVFFVCSRSEREKSGEWGILLKLKGKMYYSVN